MCNAYSTNHTCITEERSENEVIFIRLYCHNVFKFVCNSHEVYTSVMRKCNMTALYSISKAINSMKLDGTDLDIILK